MEYSVIRDSGALDDGTMTHDFNDAERRLHRAELSASVQQYRKRELAQRITLTETHLQEFFNKFHGKDGRFGSGKGSGGGGGGSLFDKRAAHQDNKDAREIFEFMIADAKRNGAPPKEINDLQKTAKSIEPMIVKSKKDLFDHADQLKNDGGRKARKELDKEVESVGKRIGELKGQIDYLSKTGRSPDSYKPKHDDVISDKVALTQRKRDLKDEQDYHAHLVGKP